MPSPRTLAAVVFTLLATVLLGAIALTAATGLPLEPPNRDIWQHVAALRALMQDLTAPANPFVIGKAESRHFHPLWVALAGLNLTFGLSVWQGLQLATYLSMALLGVGIYVFARAMFSNPWAPALLLLTVLFAWGLPLAHTGFHSVPTLLYGAVYPATFLIGLTFLLWAATIHALGRPRRAMLLIPLVALMFATHQLGAVIALIGVAGFVLGQPEVPFKRRVLTSLAVLAGLVLSLLWPYHNPLLLMLRPGNSTWDGGPDFYGLAYLTACLVPALLGVFGLRTRHMRPLALALGLFACAYAIGLMGVQIAGRFLMPIVVVLQIGLVAYLLDLAQNLRASKLRQTILWGGWAVVIAVQIALSGLLSGPRTAPPFGADISAYEAARALTADIPDTEQVAAFDITAWPIVGTGQKVLSVPWPEPGIADLAARQQAVLDLFDPQATGQERRDRARALNIRTLLADRRLLPETTLYLLESQAARTEDSGNLTRFDLFD